MKAYELLMLYKKVFVCLHRNGLSSESIKDLDLFKAYKQKMQEGKTLSLIIEELSREFKIKSNAVKRIIDYLEADLKV